MSRRLRRALAPRAAAPRAGSRFDSESKRGAVVSGRLPGPLILDLVAALIQGGAAPGPALRSIAAALDRIGDDRSAEFLALAARAGRPSGDPPVGPPGRPPGGGPGRSPGVRPGGPEEGPAEGPAGDRTMAAVEEALWLAGRAGLAPTALVQRAAEQERRRSQAAAVRAVRRLEVLLVVPAGLCLLPAFVLLGVVPVVLDLVLGSR